MMPLSLLAKFAKTKPNDDQQQTTMDFPFGSERFYNEAKDMLQRRSFPERDYREIFVVSPFITSIAWCHGV